MSHARQLPAAKPPRASLSSVFRPLSSERGFSLLEISVSLLILGLLGLGLWKFLPALNTVSETEPPEAQLALADEAILGFILQRHRLPCPDGDGDGMEDGNDADGCTYITGAFPGRTLGLRFAVPLNYGVYHPSALTRHDNAHTPPLPPVVTGNMEWPLSVDMTAIIDPFPLPGMPDLGGHTTIPPPNVAAPGELSTLANTNLPRQHPTATEIAAANSAINGLDFCANLRAISRSPGVALTANGIPVAYALAHPGKLDANGDGNPFDGGNAGASFAAPHLAATNEYDDATLAMGFNALGARLSCPAYLSRANAAGHTARAAYDNYRFALAFLQYRAFALDGAYGDLQQAHASVTLSAVNLAASIAAGIISTSAGIMTTDEVVGAVLLAAGTALTAISVGDGIRDLLSSIDGVEDAEEGVNEAIAARIEAEAQARKLRDIADAAAQRAVALEQKGLRP